MRVTLRTKILALIAGTVTGLSALIFVGLVLLGNLEIDRRLRDDVARNAEMSRELIQSEGDSMRSQIRILATVGGPNVIMNLRSDPASASTRNAYAEDLCRQLQFDAFRITDYTGTVVAKHGDIGGDPPGVRQVLQRAEDWVGLFVRGGRLWLGVAVPYRPFGNLEGSLHAFRIVDVRLAAKLQSVLNVDVLFTEAKSVLEGSLRGVERVEAPSDHPAIIRIAGEAYYAQSAPMPNARPGDRLELVTLRSYESAQSVYVPLRYAVLALFVVGLLVALAGGRAVANGLSKPLDKVVQAAQALRGGKWPEPIAITRNDELGLLQLVFNEMSESLRKSQDRLLGLLDRDPLTGLLNHRKFHERVKEECQRSHELGSALALLIVDVDRFKDFNERRGHGEGDRLLTELAEIIRETAPNLSVASRYGGEEFAILLPNVAVEFVEKYAEGLRRLFEASSLKAGSPATVSVGFAALGVGTGEAEGLILAAELALSRAKQLGRNTVCRFDNVPGADETSDPFRLSRLLNGDQSLAAVQALAAAVDAKDSYTRGHSLRVAEIAADLARETGRDTDFVELVYTTGTLHDVGKIGVPDAILKKTDKLTEEERSVMETHPVLGEVIVRKVPKLADTLPGVRHHHEHWDGGGYPDGLAGEAIPLTARYLALADTYDAMTSDRPYRPGMNPERALAEIERCAGTQFDPELAPQFVRMMRRALPERRAA
ncbi:MAG: diguanylate cyclase [Fimbriimonadaceae bacterium]|nr:diguanylate cyclase [Fimbriimonadaceae bacterium]